jgi:hypothetical protein
MKTLKKNITAILNSNIPHQMISDRQKEFWSKRRYLTDWTQTTNTIDYGIKEVTENARQTKVVLSELVGMPMPIDLLVEYSDGTESFTSTRMMSFENQNPNSEKNGLNDWAWAYPTYEFSIAKAKSTIKKHYRSEFFNG